MAISDRIESIEQHLTDDWNSVESLGADTSFDKNIENIAAALDEVYEELPKVTGEGTSISLSPTKKGGIKLDLKGNTSQAQTTQSKNLLPNTATTQTINDLTFTVNNDKSISISGTPTATTTFSINTSNIKLPAGTYTMSTHKEGTTSGNAYINVRLADESANVTTINLHIASSSTFTLEQETELYVRFYSSSNITFTDFKIYPMIESGETVTDYVEFVPNSPSPYYPQDIHVVSGDNTINVCGKNLISNDIVGSVGWSGTNINYEGASIKISKSGTGGISANAHTNIRYFSLEAGKTYTFSMNYKSGTIVTEGATYGWAFYIYGVNKDGSTSSSIGYRWTCGLSKTTTTPSNHITFTPDKDFIGFKLGCYIPGGSPKTNGDVYFDCQVEVGELTSYEAYKGASYPITLGSSTNTFDITKVIEGVFNDNSQYNSKRLTFFGDLKNSGWVVNVVCNNPNLKFNLHRVSLNTISSSNEDLQSTGYAVYNECCIQFNGEGYFALNIVKYDESDITLNDIGSNDFVITQGYELCKLGEYQDYIYKNNGIWYLHKDTLKIAINHPNWVKQADYLFYKRFIYITDIAISKIQTYCNQFAWDGRNSGMVNLPNNHFALQSSTAFYVKDNRYQNVSSFQAWVEKHPLIVYLKLEEPTDTQITDSTLISQLETVKRSFNGQTNITQTNDDLPFELTASALLDVNTQIEHLEAQIEALS